MAARVKTDNSGILPVYIVFGKDRRRAVDTLHELITSVLGDADPQLAISQFDGNDAQWADVADELKTLPFLAENRIVVVKEADTFISRYRKRLEEYLDNPSPTGVLIMQAESLPGNTILAKKAAKAGKVVDCSPVKAKQLPAFLREYARERHGLRLDAGAVSLLIELAGEESAMLASEIDKLAAYVGGDAPQKTITAQDVASLVGHNRQINVFNVIDELNRGDTGKALHNLESMLQQDREAEFKAVGAFAWHLRRLYQARCLLEQGSSERQIIRQLRIWANPQQFIQQVRQLTTAGIASALQELLQIDIAAKTGAGTVKTGLEKFIVKFSRKQGMISSGNRIYTHHN